MFSVDLIDLPDDDQVNVSKWAQQPEAMQLLIGARSKRAEAMAKAGAAALKDPLELIAGKAQLSPDAVHNLAEAARLTIFLEVWNELAHGEHLHTARVTVT
jgi:hypothetical protein